MGAGRAGHSPPFPHLHAIFPSPPCLSLSPRCLPQPFTRVRGWPHASPRKGRLIPLGQGLCLLLCIQALAPPQPWTGFSLPCCSLCCFSSRAMEFVEHLHSREVSGELSSGMHGVSPLPPCHQPALGPARRWRKKKHPTSVKEAKELSQVFSQGSKSWRWVCFHPLHCFRGIVGGLHRGTAKGAAGQP